MCNILLDRLIAASLRVREVSFTRRPWEMRGASLGCLSKTPCKCKYCHKKCCNQINVILKKNKIIKKLKHAQDNGFWLLTVLPRESHGCYCPLLFNQLIVIYTAVWEIWSTKRLLGVGLNPETAFSWRPYGLDLSLHIYHSAKLYFP